MVFEAGQWEGLEDNFFLGDPNDLNEKSGSLIRLLLLIRKIKGGYEIVVIGLGPRLNEALQTWEQMNTMFAAWPITIPITNIAKIGENLTLAKQKSIPFARTEWSFKITWSDKHPQKRIAEDETHNRANQRRTFDIENDRRVGRRHCSSRRQTKEVTMRRDKKVEAEMQRKRLLKTIVWTRLETFIRMAKEFDRVVIGWKDLFIK